MSELPGKYLQAATLTTTQTIGAAVYSLRLLCNKLFSLKIAIAFPIRISYLAIVLIEHGFHHHTDHNIHNVTKDNQLRDSVETCDQFGSGSYRYRVWDRHPSHRFYTFSFISKLKFSAGKEE